MTTDVYIVPRQRDTARAWELAAYAVFTLAIVLASLRVVWPPRALGDAHGTVSTDHG